MTGGRTSLWSKWRFSTLQWKQIPLSPHPPLPPPARYLKTVESWLHCMFFAPLVWLVATAESSEAKGGGGGDRGGGGGVSEVMCCVCYIWWEMWWEETKTGCTNSKTEVKSSHGQGREIEFLRENSPNAQKLEVNCSNRWGLYLVEIVDFRAVMFPNNGDLGWFS